MHMLAAALLASTVGFSGGTQKQQIQAAGALWRIFLRIQSVGEFMTADGSLVARTVTHDHGYGSGVMVSPDGYMLTARHVVDPSEAVKEACKLSLRVVYAGKAVVHTMRMDYIMSDIVGNQVVGRLIVVPAKTGADICDDPTAARWTRDAVFPFRIVALDTVADLALVKLELEDAPYVPMTSPSVDHGDPMFAFGWEDDKFVRVTGTFVRWCERVSGIRKGDGTLDTEHPQLMMRVTIPVKEGMSGGPIMAGSELAGITSVGSKFEAVMTGPDGQSAAIISLGGFGVPAAYIRAWYLWTTGKSNIRPAQVCDDPFVPDAPSK